MHRGPLFALSLAICASCPLPAAAAPSAAEILERMKVTVEPSTPLLPADVRVENLRPAVAAAVVGQVELAQGDVVILPPAGGTAYRVTKRQDAYAGDTLITGPRSRAVLALRDQSSVGLAEHTRLRLVRIQLDQDTGVRDSTVALDHGRARFRVPKSTGARESFKVTTPAAIAGVRGSDFGLHAFGRSTLLVTGEATNVRFAGLLRGSTSVASTSAAAVEAAVLTGTPLAVGGAALGALSSIVPFEALGALDMPEHLVPQSPR